MDLCGKGRISPYGRCQVRSRLPSCNHWVTILGKLCRFLLVMEVWIYFLFLEFWPRADIGTLSTILERQVFAIFSFLALIFHLTSWITFHKIIKKHNNVLPGSGDIHLSLEVQDSRAAIQDLFFGSGFFFGVAGKLAVMPFICPPPPVLIR